MMQNLAQRRAAPCRQAAKPLRPLPPVGVFVRNRAIVADEAKIRLLSLVDIQRSQRGLASTEEDKKEILDAVADLQSASAGSTTTGPYSSATWELVWTTEKETLWIIKNANWFGTDAGPVYQVIDMEEQRLQNIITFPPEGAFIVDSSAVATGPQSVDFKFEAARLKLPEDKIWNLPPFGSGWFTNVYLDRDLRVSVDVRGDTLITRRVAPPTLL